MKKKINDAMKVLLVGFAAAFLCAIAFAFAAVAVLLYFHIPAVAGYQAVADFLVATIAACMVFVALYVCGAWIVRTGTFSR